MLTKIHASANDGMLAVRVISLTFDDVTQRLAGSKAVREGASMSSAQSISALPKDYLLRILGDGEDHEVEAERRANKVDEIMARFGAVGMGTGAGRSLSGEDMYDRHATR